MSAAPKGSATLDLEDRLRLLSGVVRDFAEHTPDYPRLLETIARKVGDGIGATCMVSLLREDGKVLLAEVVHSPDADDARAVRAVTDRVEVQSLLQATIDDGTPFMDPPLEGPAVGDALSTLDLLTGKRQRLWVALRLHGRTLGLLALSRAGEAAPRFTQADCDLAQTLADHATLAISNSLLLLAERARLAAAEPGRVAELIIADDLCVVADPALCRSLMDNLLGNAWKFSSGAQSARIELGAVHTDGEQVFFVRDNGAGFDMAYAKKLFAPFQRLHSAAEFPGTGIGLATVQRIVRRHGGRLWAEGAVNEGATFHFTLPEHGGANT